MLSEFVRIPVLSIRGINLQIYGEYANELNFRMEFRSAYSLNTWNESVRILGIRGMNLLVS
jgi:hypothetical protein